MKLFCSLGSIDIRHLSSPTNGERAGRGVRGHFELHAQDLEWLGLTPVDAERRARIAFGRHERFKEEWRDALGTRLLETFLEDLHFAARTLRSTLGVSFVAGSRFHAAGWDPA